LGWSYAAPAAADLIDGILKKQVLGKSAFAIESVWQAMNHHLRNAGRPGVGMMAVAAVDVAMWDLKAKLLGLPLVDLFGAVREADDINGSGGFTSYREERLAEQLSGWASEGIGRVKMKVGRDADADLHRVSVARKAVGDDAQLFVDANGGYTRKQALWMAERFRGDFNVSWFEEPRPSDDLEGLRLMSDRGPAGMDIAAGEYGDTTEYFRRMLQAGAVDCLQADATRCGGYTGFLKVAALCEAFQMPLSAHCAPQLHAHVCCAASPLRHVEYFHDHNRIDRMLFDGALDPVNGQLKPDRSRVGHGMTFKASDAEHFRT
jgi:L-alanine-DL-glutamate epimerase-like enolase superfamily enzyme